MASDGDRSDRCGVVRWAFCVPRTIGWRPTWPRRADDRAHRECGPVAGRDGAGTTRLEAHGKRDDGDQGARDQGADWQDEDRSDLERATGPGASTATRRSISRNSSSGRSRRPSPSRSVGSAIQIELIRAAPAGRRDDVDRLPPAALRLREPPRWACWSCATRPSCDGTATRRVSRRRASGSAPTRSP